MVVAGRSPEVDFIYGRHVQGGKGRGGPHTAGRVPRLPRTSDACAKFVFSPRFNGTQPPEGTCCS